MSSQRPLPVVICGKNQKVSSSVTTALRPEYEVIQSIMSPEIGKAELPSLLRGTAPPAAIIVGGGYTQEDLDSMRAACKGLRPTAWLKVEQRYGLGSSSAPMPAFKDYGVEVAGRVRACLDKLAEKGDLDRDQVQIV